VARLHEYQGKSILAEHGIGVPDGRTVRSANEAEQAAAELGCPVVLKVQAWITGRKDQGGVVFANTADDARQAAERLLSMSFGNFPVEEVLIEKTIDINRELFVSLSIDDASQAPVLLIDAHGGTGIEERADGVARLAVDVREGVDPGVIHNAVVKAGVDVSFEKPLVETIEKIPDIARQYDARSLEINPLVVTRDAEVFAADCRMTIDDYAVFRHPELGIEIARELDHPATKLERIAYAVEQNDHRGTFYFAQLPTDGADADHPLIGFHGAGGGGSMMSMDAVTNAGFTLANFCDTSGNPSSAKVYRAARIILTQPNLVGYFGSGSGVASQEQFWSAYGLAKVFNELNMAIPAVLRLGGNSEERAVQILHDACKHLPGTVEGYRKDDTPAFCAERFKQLVKQSSATSSEMKRKVPDFVGSNDAYSFPINGGRVWINHNTCDDATSDFIIQNSAELMKKDDATGKPVLAVAEDEVADKDSEMIALEVEARIAGKPAVFVDLPLEGIDGE